MNVTPPTPFEVGQTYADRDGDYTVISIDGDQITIEYVDGRRKTQDAKLKAQIHRSVMVSRRPAKLTTRSATGIRRQMILEILAFEADQKEHSGAEIDAHLLRKAHALGYSEHEIQSENSHTKRTRFGNDGDWAKAAMTEDRLHQVVGKVKYTDSALGERRTRNVYRITAAGLDELNAQQEV